MIFFCLVVSLLGVYSVPFAKHRYGALTGLHLLLHVLPGHVDYPPVSDDPVFLSSLLLCFFPLAVSLSSMTRFISALSKGVQSSLTKMPLNSVQPRNFLASPSTPTLLLSFNVMSRGPGSPVFLALSWLQDATSPSTSSARPQRSVKKTESALILSLTSSALLSGTPNQTRFAFLRSLSQPVLESSHLQLLLPKFFQAVPLDSVPMNSASYPRAVADFNFSMSSFNSCIWAFTSFLFNFSLK